MQFLVQDQAAVLTDLCAICHVNAIKYTCPRCSIHTCSLSCVKKHKQWAQCSGVRDPAEYRKRGDLATPASIDKDFNFITGVERSIQSADDDATNRGIHLGPARTKPTHHSNKSKIELETEARNITIIRAPKGLSRSKVNKTHWHGPTKCVLWTIEWIDYESTRKINNVHEFKTAAEAYIGTFGKKYALKRKRSINDVDELDQAAKQIQNHTRTDTAVASESTNDHPGRAARTQMDTSSRENVVQPAEEEKPCATPKTMKLGQASNQTSVVSTDGLYFYLLRPNTEARHKVLIPVPPDLPLKDVLTNKTLLEFPTMYVLQSSPADLESPFLLEQSYNDKIGRDIPINVTLAQHESTSELGLEDGEVQDVDVDVDAPIDLSQSKVLEVLAKDLSS